MKVEYMVEDMRVAVVTGDSEVAKGTLGTALGVSASTGLISVQLDTGVTVNLSSSALIGIL